MEMTCLSYLFTKFYLKLDIFFQFHSVSVYGQQGRQSEPSVKTLPLPVSAGPTTNVRTMTRLCH